MKLTSKAVLVLTACLLACAPLYAKERPSSTPSLPTTPYAPGVVYVKMRTGSTAIQDYKHVGLVAQSAGASSFSRVLDQLHASATVPFDADAPKDQVTHDLGIDRMYVIYFSNHTIDAQRALAMLLGSGEVECGSVRYLFPKLYTPNDPQLSSQYAVTNMHLKAAWDVTKGDSNILIADVDDAVNTDHQDLKNAVKIGYDVVGNVTVNNGEQFKPDNDPRPDYIGNSHGTHTAGCIAATGDNHVGIVGSGFGCRLIAIKATGNDPPVNGQEAGIAGGYEGIHYASTHGARVINCSWGGPVSGDQSFANTFLLEAQSRNALMVCAAGNNATNVDNTSFYPACGPGVLAVGATGPSANPSSDQPADYSNYGGKVGIWAPGTSILSCNYPGNSSYNAEDGTSFASPLAAGVAGLVTSLHPDWAPHFIARQIHATADNTVVPELRNQYWGRINAESALTVTPQPGLLITGYAIDGVANDSLGAPGTAHKLTLTFKNVTAAGSNIKAKLIAATGYTVDGQSATLGSVGLGATVTGDLNITRNGAYSEGLLPIQCELYDGAEYDDIVTVNIPLTREHGFAVEMKATAGSSIKRVSHTAAWAAYGNEDQNSGAVVYASYARQLNGVWSDTTVLNDRSEAPYCVEAWDSLTAWFGTGPKNNTASVIMTNDGGKSFKSVDVSSFTPFVNTVHFFDNPGGGPREGIIIGDPASTSSISAYGIGRTLDGGKTWTHVSTAPKSSQTSSGFEASWNNSAAWVGNKGWYGTNNSKIWRTTDRGTTWTSTGTTGTLKNAFSIAFDDDGLHGFSCFRSATTGSSGTSSGGAGMCKSTDGGATWKKITMPVPGMIPGVVAFVPGTDMVIVTADSGVFRSTDFGTTWTPIGIPLTFDAGNAAHISVYRDSSKLTVSLITSLSGVASYSEAYSAPAGSIVFDAMQLNIGHVAVGSSNALPVTITNTEKSSVTINNVKVATASGAFKPLGFLNGSQLPVTLAPRGMTRDTFQFAPSVEGLDTAVATFTITDADARTFDTTVMLFGQGVPAAGVITGAQESLVLSVSPNPAHGDIQISCDVPVRKHIRVVLFDAVGREVSLLLDTEAEPGTKSLTFSASSLMAGTYYVVLTPERGQPITRAISVEK